MRSFEGLPLLNIYGNALHFPMCMQRHVGIYLYSSIAIQVYTVYMFLCMLHMCTYLCMYKYDVISTVIYLSG